MKKLLTTVACLICFALNASAIGINPIERQDFSTFAPNLDRMELNSQETLSPCFAKGFKGGGRGKKMGPSSKRKDPNQANLGNNKGKEHTKNQTESNRQKHEPAESRRDVEQAKSQDKNDQRHGNQ